MLLAVINSTGYDIVLALHIFAVVMGFGGVALTGAYAKSAMDNPGPAGGAIAAAAHRASSIAEVFIFAVPVLGIGLVAMSKDTQGNAVYTFEQGWVSASFLLYIVGLVLAFAFLRPASKRFVTAIADPAQEAEAKRLYSRQAMVGGITNLLWVVILFLMVLKPGA